MGRRSMDNISKEQVVIKATVKVEPSLHGFKGCRQWDWRTGVTHVWEVGPQKERAVINSP